MCVLCEGVCCVQASVSVSVTDGSSDVPVQSLVVGGYDVRVSSHIAVIDAMIFTHSSNRITFVNVMILTHF